MKNNMVELDDDCRLWIRLVRVFVLGFDYRNTAVENLALKVVAVFKKT